MDVNELVDINRETVKLVKIMHTVKDSSIGINMKKREISKLKKELLNLWLNNKLIINRLPSKNIVASIAMSYDQQMGTNYYSSIFTDDVHINKAHVRGKSMDSYSNELSNEYSRGESFYDSKSDGTSSDIYSEYLTSIDSEIIKKY